MTSTTSGQELWSWLDDPDAATEVVFPDTSGVLAVVVVHNGSDWLPRHLSSLEKLDPKPGAIIAVEAGSTDDSSELLEVALGSGIIDSIVTAEATDSFAECVNQALGSSRPEYVWLLHDDCAPWPDALGMLVRESEASETAILLPTLLAPTRRNYPDIVVEAGQTISENGVRVGFVEEDEIHQGQLPATQVLGGSTAGMLIRGEVFQELAGLAPETQLHREGLEFCWRALDAGYSAMTCPQAVVVHHQAGRFGERHSELGPYHLVDRLAALRLMAARGSTKLGRWSWLRAIGFFLAKSPSQARSELAALRRHNRSPEAVESLQARLVDEPVDARDLLPKRRWWFDKVLGSVLADIGGRAEDVGSTTSLDELTGDDFADRGVRRRRWFSPQLFAVALAVLAGLAALRTLVGGPIAGGGLLPAPQTFADAWRSYLTPLPSAVGSAPPWLGFAALGSLLTLGQPGWFGLITLVLGPAAAVAAAGAMLRRLEVDSVAAAGLSLVWGGATIMFGTVTGGDISGLVLAICLPMMVRSLAGIGSVDNDLAERLRSPAGLAWWLLVAVAIWPVLWLLALAIAVVVIINRPRRVVEVGVVLGIPLLFLLPWLPELAASPGRLMTGIDPIAWPEVPAISVDQLVERLGSSGLPWWGTLAFFAGLIILSGAAIVAESSRVKRIIWIAVIAVTVLAGLVVSRLGMPIGDDVTRPLLSGWALLAIAAFLWPHMRGEANRLLSGLFGLLGLGAMVLWGFIGFHGPVGPAAQALPSYVTDVITSERATKALLITRDNDELTWNLVSAEHPVWGSAERPLFGGDQSAYAELVQLFVGGDAPEDLSKRLSDLAISHVYARGFDPERIAALGNAADLVGAEAGDDAVVWSVVGLVSRYHIIDGDEVSAVVDGQVTAADHERLLQVVGKADANWQVRVDGKLLEHASGQPAATLVLPAELGGELDVSRHSTGWLPFWHGVLLALLLILRLPTAGTRRRARRGM
ncbi:MAG: hypothetical protein CSA64_00650 [Arachnia propionica]|nr:MAG: hypothetical protein CSA64_00650 [Arachnia propionica]